MFILHTLCYNIYVFLYVKMSIDNSYLQFIFDYRLDLQHVLLHVE